MDGNLGLGVRSFVALLASKETEYTIPLHTNGRRRRRGSRPLRSVRLHLGNDMRIFPHNDSEAEFKLPVLNTGGVVSFKDEAVDPRNSQFKLLVH